MTIIKSSWEIAMEKAKKIDMLSPEEMAEIKQQEKIEAIMGQFYKGQVGSDDLWHHLKGFPDNVLINAQKNLLQSLTFFSNDHEIQKRNKGILAIENLKNTNQLSDIEFHLEQLKRIQEEYQRNKEQLTQNLREEFERNPQKRLQAFHQGNQIMIKEMSMEEALEQNQELYKQLKQAEKQSKKRFDLIKEKLTEIIKP